MSHAHRSWSDCEHGDHCDCMLLARAVGAGAEAVDVNYCRQVLRKHWTLHCNHGARRAQPKATLELPPHDSGDPVQSILLANAL